MKTTDILTTAILAAAGLALSTSSARAQNPNFANGDLILGFQLMNGTGSDRSVLINLGNTATVFRDSNTNNINLDNFVNINTILTGAYGAGWYDDTDLFWGAAGVWSNENPPGTLQNFDPEQSIYISKSRTAVGANENLKNSTINTPSASAHTAAAGQIMSLNGRFELSSGSQLDLDNTLANTWENFNATSPTTFAQSTAFGAYTGGVQQRFGATSYGTFSSGTVEGALDLYRGQLVNDISGQFAEGGSLRVPEFQGILTIDSGGNVDYLVTPVPEPSSIGMFAMGSALVGLFRRRRTRNA